jgi:hypothetical protein
MTETSSAGLISSSEEWSGSAAGAEQQRNCPGMTAMSAELVLESLQHLRCERLRQRNLKLHPRLFAGDLLGDAQQVMSAAMPVCGQ